jgi:hypothetical protein
MTKKAENKFIKWLDWLNKDRNIQGKYPEKNFYDRPLDFDKRTKILQEELEKNYAIEAEKIRLEEIDKLINISVKEMQLSGCTEEQARFIYQKILDRKICNIRVDFRKDFR